MNSDKLFLFLVALVIFLLSLFVAPFHIYGDQEYYLTAYKEMAGLNIIEGFIVYQSHIYTNEPVHFFISWFLSNFGMSKNIAMSALNSLLGVLFVKVLLIRKYPLWLILILLFNSYLMVMFFTLERNKIAFIFILLIILHKKSFLYVLAILSHASSIVILLPSVFVNFVIENKLALSKKFTFIVFPISALVIYHFLSDHFIDKFLSYSDPDLNDGGAPFLLVAIFFLALIFSKDKKKVIFYYVPLVSLFIFIGPTRLNMYGFFIYLYLSNPKNAYFQAVTGFLGLYLLFKSYEYLIMIINFGG
jgi:hypothetical protein